MQTVRKLRKRSGFTLVELLIVIIIIGILAGAMMMLAGSGTDRAEATKIISDLRGLKAAALMYYADNPSTADSALSGDIKDLLGKYMDRDISRYAFENGSGDLTWFVGYKDLDGKDGIQTALDGSAKESALLGPDKATQYDEADDEVWMKAR